jgi:hypothetical protein
MPIEELIFTPENAEYYAAFGAVIFGLVDNVDDTAGRYKGLDELKTYIHTGRGERLGEMADGPLVENAEELEAFKRPPHKMAGVATNLVYAI